MLKRLVYMARTNLGHGRCDWDSYEQVVSVPPPPVVPVVVEEPDAQASEPSSATPAMRARVGQFEETATVSQEYCPPPIVMAVHREPVSMVEGPPELLEEVLKETPIFLPKAEVPMDEGDEDEAPLPACAEMAWVLPPCIEDPARDYNVALRRLQLKMRLPGSAWDVEALARMEALQRQSPLEVPFLTGMSTIQESAQADAPVLEAALAEEDEEANHVFRPTRCSSMPTLSTLIGVA